MKLIDEWRQAYKFISVNCMTLAAALQGAWIYIPDDLRTAMPHYLVNGITIALLVLGVIGRMIKQDAPPSA